jgi:hypothetical protein
MLKMGATALKYKEIQEGVATRMALARTATAEFGKIAHFAFSLW